MPIPSGTGRLTSPTASERLSEKGATAASATFNAASRPHRRHTQPLTSTNVCYHVMQTICRSSIGEAEIERGVNANAAFAS